MFQRKGGNTILKFHVAVGAGEGGIPQRYCEMELLCGISAVTVHRFGNLQVPRCRFRGGFRGRGVGNGKALRVGTGNDRLIVCHGNLLDGVGDFLPVEVLIQSGEGSLPVVIFAKCQRRPFAPINQQFYSDTFRAFAILIVIVVPNLFH